VETIRPKSLITRPLEGSEVHGSRVRVEGFAWAGPSGVKLVEISADDGATWLPARLESDATGTAWRQWSYDLPLGRPETVHLVARATDGSGESQPAEARANASGYANNSMHRVSFRVD